MGIQNVLEVYQRTLRAVFVDCIFKSNNIIKKMSLNNIIKLSINLQQILQMNSDKLPTSFKQLPKAHDGPVYVVKFNAQGEYCMSGSEDRSVNLYNPTKGLLIKKYKNLHNYDVYSLAIMRDNTKFITGGGDKNIIMTDVAQGKSFRKYTGHTARVNSICLNQTNNVIISGSYDTTVRCWDNRTDSHHPIEVIRGFKDSISKVEILGNQIACSSMDGSVKFFDIRKGEVTSDEIDQPVQKFSVAHSGKAYIISATNNYLYLIERSSGKKIQQYSGHQVGQYTIDLTFTQKDSHILTGSQDGKLFIYDLMKKNPIKTMQGHTKALSALDLHERGFLSGSHDGTVCFWKF